MTDQLHRATVPSRVCTALLALPRIEPSPSSFFMLPLLLQFPALWPDMLAPVLYTPPTMSLCNNPVQVALADEQGRGERGEVRTRL